jgi:hypothetical protein
MNETSPGPKPTPKIPLEEGWPASVTAGAVENNLVHDKPLG